MMREWALEAIGVALIVGLAIGAQSTLNTNLGRVIGPVNSGLIINFLGGLCAGVILFAIVLAKKSPGTVFLSGDTLKIGVIAGILGIVVMIGAAFAFQRIGITAGTVTVIMGQMLVGIVVDARGWGGLEPAPVDTRRILGLLVLGVAVFLLTPSR